MDDRDPSAHPGLPTQAHAVPSLNSLFASVTGEAAVEAYEAYQSRPGGSFSNSVSLFRRLGLPHPSERAAESSSATAEQQPSAPQSSIDVGMRRRSRRVAAREAARAAEATPSVCSDTPVVPPKSNKRSAPPDLGTHVLLSKKYRVKPPPNAKDDSNYEVAVTTENETEGASAASTTEDGVSCCICMSEPDRQDLSVVNGCDHKFCFDCIAQWADRENKCPLCKVRFSKISRVHKSCCKRKGEKSPVLTKRVKDRNQRADLVSGAALEAMLSSIAASNRASVGGARLGRVLFASVGGPMQLGRRNRSAPRRAALFVEGESDEDSTDDSGFNFPHDFNALMRTMNASRGDSRRRSPFESSLTANLHHSFQASQTGGSNSWTVPAPPLFNFQQQHHQPSQQPFFPPRSYASNGNDTGAGRAANNPLEIDDSDDDDDEVEIIERPTAATSTTA